MVYENNTKYPKQCIECSLGRILKDSTFHLEWKDCREQKGKRKHTAEKHKHYSRERRIHVTSACVIWVSDKIVLLWTVKLHKCDDNSVFWFTKSTTTAMLSELSLTCVTKAETRQDFKERGKHAGFGSRLKVVVRGMFIIWVITSCNSLPKDIYAILSIDSIYIRSPVSTWKQHGKGKKISATFSPEYILFL